VAGPTDERHGKYVFSIPPNISDTGSGWRMYLVSIYQFEQDDWDFANYHEEIFRLYKSAKRSCGGEGVFYKEVRELNAQEKGSVECIIDGITNTTHCPMTSSSASECLRYVPHKVETDYSLDRILLTFGSFYRSYVYDVGRADFYHHFEPLECNIENNTCVFSAFQRENIGNPFIVVLENVLSRDQIYFSDMIEISGFSELHDKAFAPCENLPCDGEIVIYQEVSQMVLGDGELEIKLDSYSLISPNEEGTEKSSKLTENNSQPGNKFSVVLLIIILIIFVTIIFIHQYKRPQV
jgi:hypothetical protein